MSLWRQRKAIEHAVAGLLSAEDEAKLRSHLAGCAECRRDYDQRSMQARILAGDAGAAKGANERELARLMAAIAPPVAPARARGWLPAFAFAAASAAVFVLLFGLPDSAPKPDLVWRGAVDAGPSTSFELLVYGASTDGGPLAQKANFPLDPTLHLRPDQWVAFAPREASRKFGFFRTVLVNEQGEPLVLESGHSVSLDPGRWRVFGIEAVRYRDQHLKQAATGLDKNLKRLPLDEGIQSYGEIIVEP